MLIGPLSIGSHRCLNVIIQCGSGHDARSRESLAAAGAARPGLAPRARRQRARRRALDGQPSDVRSDERPKTLQRDGGPPPTSGSGCPSYTARTSHPPPPLPADSGDDDDSALASRARHSSSSRREAKSGHSASGGWPSAARAGNTLASWPENGWSKRPGPLVQGAAGGGRRGRRSGRTRQAGRAGRARAGPAARTPGRSDAAMSASMRGRASDGSACITAM
jgi:hypothetical protein